MTTKAAEPAPVRSSSTAGSPPAPAKQRLLSLDVFRGLTLALMVFVNNPANPDWAYAPFKHSVWNGWTPTDQVFPSFIFIVGVAIPFAFRNRLARGATEHELILKIVRRTILLFLVGVALNGFPYYDLANIRIMGILQRIALCYLAASILYLKARPKTIAAISASLLVFYFVMMKFVPVPGYGAGIMELNGNWVQYFDIRLLGVHHLQNVYLSFTGNNILWESKGLFSTLPAIAGGLIGVLVGQHLRTSAPALQKLVNIFSLGLVSMFAGEVWSVWYPINMNLWSPAYVLFTTGMAMTILALCYYIIDVKGVTWWTKPFVIFGVNALFIWVFSSAFRETLEIIKMSQANRPPISVKESIAQWLASWAGQVNGSELFALVYVLFFLGIMSILYSRRIYIRL